jgi:Phosphotransferase enzyme family
VSSSQQLHQAVERTVLAGHDGRSGAGLEHVRLADGTAYIVKQVTPTSDLTLALTGGTVAREYLLWRSGELDRLPPGVGHAVVDGWVEGDTTVIVMRDLDDLVLTWESRLSTAETDWVLGRIAAMHRRFLGSPPAEVVPLERVLTAFAPERIRGVAEEGNELAGLACRGWEIFAQTVPADVAGPVLVLLEDPTPLVTALGSGPVTFAHGDLATVNMARDDDTLVLLDWALATAAPGALDVAWLLAGCSSVLEPSREHVLASYASLAGPAYDDRSLRLALLAGLLWLGWNKALDAAEHPDPTKRERERRDLGWWVREARKTLDSGAL